MQCKILRNMAESDSDTDEVCEGSWSLSKRKKLKKNLCKDARKDIISRPDEENKMAEQSKKFEELKRKSSEIMLRSSIRRHKTEVRRSQKLLKRALKDPWIKAAVEEDNTSDREEPSVKEETKWKDVKSYLSVNEHLQGPVSHGDCGPKTELEYQIEDCIKEGDFEKAELLSDTLANREFAVKIARAFSAKKYHEKETEKKIEEENKQMKKLRWMFDPKERWQMKGNM